MCLYSSKLSVIWGGELLMDRTCEFVLYSVVERVHLFTLHISDTRDWDRKKKGEDQHEPNGKKNPARDKR